MSIHTLPLTGPEAVIRSSSVRLERIRDRVVAAGLPPNAAWLEVIEANDQIVGVKIKQDVRGRAGRLVRVVDPGLVTIP